MLEQYVIVKAVQEVTSKPNKSFSVRGLAKAIGISPGASGTAFEYMKKKNIVTLKIVGKTYQYKANLENPLCRQWKILFNLDQLADSGIVEQIVEKIPNLLSVLLYGSFAKGTNDEKSDVDLLVITQKPVKISFRLGEKIKRETNLTIFSLSEWKKKAAKDKVFYENIIYDSIVLHGERPVVL